MLLFASYYFYMCWQPVYALLILFSTVTTWAGARIIGSSSGTSRRKAVLTGVLTVNFAILFCYKYLGFFGGEIIGLMRRLGLAISVPEFDILLPVGISFYTFQAVGYIVDVWRHTIKPEKSLATYALFVSFFPQLVAGPIERARNLLPQFHTHHIFSSRALIKGLEMMALGYFMKLCIAENVAPYVNAVFNNLPQHNGNSVLLAAIFFTFQIFCDFGGYSLIAIGAARCMGFHLMQNFRQPYLAPSIKEFWRRWHISLTTWFTDYVYIPLGGSRVSNKRHLGNLMATFLLSGLWHGANYTFIAWGGYNGTLLCIQAIHTKLNKKHAAQNRKRSAWIDKILKLFNIAVTFLLVVIGWIFFRANSLQDAFMALKKIATERGMLYNGEGKPAIALSLLLIVALMAVEVHSERASKRKVRKDFSVTKSAIISAILLTVILLTARFEGGQFIYFQF